MSRDFLGTAVSFPLRPNGRGGLALVSGAAAVEDSIRAIISTLKGSCLFNPFLGLPPFVFQPMQDLVAAAEIFKDAIVEGDSRVEASTLRVEVAVSDEGLMQVAVSYSISGQATMRTLSQGYRLLN